MLFRSVLETIERERLDALGGIPTQVIMLLDHPDRARRDLSSLKSVLLGGAPSSPELIRRVRDTLGVVTDCLGSAVTVGRAGLHAAQQQLSGVAAHLAPALLPDWTPLRVAVALGARADREVLVDSDAPFALSADRKSVV